jgi:HAD superfamily hydrolase (TIGR01509 family)
VSAEEFRLRRTRVFLDQLGQGHDHVDALTEIYVTLYPTLDTPVPGAREVVERLARDYRLGVISNASPDVQYAKLEGLGIRGLLDCVVLSDQLGVEKPEPAIFHHAASLLGARPEESVHVGDSYAADVAGAKGAGMAACWFNPSGAARDGDVEPDFEVRTLAEVPKLLDPGGPLAGRG